MERVEDVDEDQEDGRQEGHPGGDDVGRNQETRLSGVQKTLSSLVYKESPNTIQAIQVHNRKRLSHSKTG